MSTRFFLNKKRIAFGLILFIFFNAISIWFINEPEIFIRNFLMKKEHIQIIGFLLFIYSLIMLYSSIILLLRKKEAFIISDSYLIDNSRFESVGKVYLNEIKEVKRIKKHSLKIVLKESIFKSKRLNLLKKIAFVANNGNTKNSIVVSSALLNCDIKTLEKSILVAINRAAR